MTQTDGEENRHCFVSLRILYKENETETRQLQLKTQACVHLTQMFIVKKFQERLVYPLKQYLQFISVIHQIR